MACEMCGDESGLVSALVEGVEMKVCKNCAGFGQVLRKPETAPRFLQRKKERAKRPLFAEEEVFVEDGWGDILKKARQAKGILLKNLCLDMNIKESYYSSIESNKIKPPLNLAKRLERKLNVTITSTTTGEVELDKLEDAGGLTLGDIMKKK